MEHCATCRSRHTDKGGQTVCDNVKFMMLHARDCQGTSNDGNPCNRAWCVKVKNLAIHLAMCPFAWNCKICTPSGDSTTVLKTLQTENFARRVGRGGGGGGGGPGINNNVNKKPTTIGNCNDPSILAALGLTHMGQSHENLNDDFKQFKNMGGQSNENFDSLGASFVGQGGMNVNIVRGKSFTSVNNLLGAEEEEEEEEEK